MKPIRVLQVLARLVTRSLLFVLLCCAFGAQADQVIGRFNSVSGPFSHMETPTGRAYLNLHERKVQVQLPDDWRESTVETTMELDGDTAVVMSYRTAHCDSQTALVVISGKSVWGPYRLGGCGDILAFQRSENGENFVAMQMNGQRSEAWTYSSKDKNFRGPMKIDLPGLLLGLSKAKPAIDPAPALKPPMPPKPAPIPKPKLKEAIASTLPQPVADAVVEHAQATALPRRRVEINLISSTESGF